MLAAFVALAALQLGLRLEVGPEFDSNANRSERLLGAHAVATTPPVASFLVRSTAAARLSLLGPGYRLRLGLAGGGKIFFERAAQPADVAVVQATAEAALRLAGPFFLGLQGRYYDAFQWNGCPPIETPSGPVADTACHFDFRAAGGEALLSRAGRLLDFSLGVGGRHFGWKPDDGFSFDAAAAVGGLLYHLAADEASEWNVEASGRLEWRRYHGPALRSGDDAGSPDGPRREDVDVLGSLALLYVGPLLGSVSYTVDFDRSSSFGQSYLRHVVGLKLGFELPWRLTLTTKVQVVLTDYAQPIAIISGSGLSLSIEDEARDSLLLDVERRFGKHLALSARYSVYRSGASSALLEYERHLVYLGLAYRVR